MNAALYILICLTTLFCAVLLLRAYSRVRRPLLLWSGLCFTGLTIAYLLVIFDLLIFVDRDLYTWRLSVTAVAMGLLVYGLVWESR